MTEYPKLWLSQKQILVTNISRSLWNPPEEQKLITLQHNGSFPGSANLHSLSSETNLISRTIDLWDTKPCSYYCSCCSSTCSDIKLPAIQSKFSRRTEKDCWGCLAASVNLFGGDYSFWQPGWVEPSYLFTVTNVAKQDDVREMTTWPWGGHSAANVPLAT